ncbi:hypothetical protein DPMN_109990 [Dreissena polymorpha]|uniref:Uncharacterized protein n=1 Tax=Dreissena polymorpha TaxID=45954 RepID=A0A9D4KBT0_DREPO|nr:hypothetical protein DPMN_109990 [Dreissena polymorpha]
MSLQRLLSMSLYQLLSRSLHPQRSGLGPCTGCCPGPLAVEVSPVAAVQVPTSYAVKVPPYAEIQVPHSTVRFRYLQQLRSRSLQQLRSKYSIRSGPQKGVLSAHFSLT